MIWGLEHLSQEERLQKLGLVGLEKGGTRGDPIDPYKHPKYPRKHLKYPYKYPKHPWKSLKYPYKYPKYPWKCLRYQYKYPKNPWKSLRYLRVMSRGPSQKKLCVLGGSWGRAGGDVAPSLPRRPREDVTVKKEKKERERQRDGHGRGRGRPEVIQSHSIFEQGPAEMMKKKGKGSFPLFFFGGERSLLG